MAVGQGEDAESAIRNYIDSNPPQESYTIGNCPPVNMDDYMNDIREGEYDARVKLLDSNRVAIWRIRAWQEDGQWKAERVQ